MAPLLHAQGLLTEVDTLNLIQYCQLWQVSHDAIRKGGIADNWVLNQFRMFSAMYGLDPASRGKINIKEPEKKENAFAKKSRRNS